MRAEVRSIKSIKLIPESDSDRAVLKAWEDMSIEKGLAFHIQSYSSVDGVFADLCIGFTGTPQSPGAGQPPS